MQATSSISHQSVYQIVTEQIIKQLESGVAPWHRPWTTQMPKNLVSKREYRGINVFLLASLGYGSPYWLRYKQATELRRNVRRGEHGSKVVFWMIDKYETDDADGQTVAKTSALLRYYTVFNVGMSSSWRSPPRPVMKMAEPRKPYNWRTQENGGRREGGGGARSSCEAA